MASVSRPTTTSESLNPSTSPPAFFPPALRATARPEFRSSGVETASLPPVDGGPIGARVVDQDQLVRLARRRERREAELELSRVVVEGNDDAQAQWIAHRTGSGTVHSRAIMSTHPLSALAVLLAVGSSVARAPSERPWAEILGASRAQLPAPQAEVAWRTDLAAAMSEARAANRPLFVTLRCLPCKQLELRPSRARRGPELDPCWRSS